MTEKGFKNHYVATFLATYTAMHYEQACAMGRHDELEDRAIVIEDAKHLADCACSRVKPDDGEDDASRWMRDACAWIEGAFCWVLDIYGLRRCPRVFEGARALLERCPAQLTDAERKDWRAEAERLREERDEARREAEMERDRICHPDHGGHVFPWERDGKDGGAE